jgi:Zn ribbon nucleic-acid-binding protein
MAETCFDITDGKNRYEPCPACGADFGMGLVVRNGTLAVECDCGFRGTEIHSDQPSSQSDRAAFDAWNQITRVK